MIGGFGGRIAGGQRRSWAGGFVALALTTLVWAVVFDGGAEERAEVRAALDDPETTTSTTSRPPEASTTTTGATTSTTTTAPTASSTPGETDDAPAQPRSSVTQPPTSPPTTSAPTTITTTTTTTTQPCLDSFEERCGAFRWSTDPGTNRAATYEYHVSPARPVVGEEVRFTATVTDADAVPNVPNFWRGPKGSATPYCGGFGVEKAFGPWQVPTRAGGTTSGEDRFTFAESGVHTMTLCFATSSWVRRPPVSQYCPGGGLEFPGMGWTCLEPHGEHTKVEFEIEVFPS